MRSGVEQSVLDPCGALIFPRLLLQGATSVRAGMKLLQPGMGRGSMWEVPVPSLVESFATVAYGHLIQPRVPFSGSAVSRPHSASWLPRSLCLGLSLRLQDHRSSSWMRRREPPSSRTRTPPKAPRLMERQRLRTACSTLAISTELSSRLRLPVSDSERLCHHSSIVSAYELVSPTC